jgi:hypothetical protein
MTHPRFSIVIPTRERARTLEFAIRSCLAQHLDDYEIVVCDNCGSPATRELVDRFHSPRIRYVRSDVPLAMSDNWELAVSQARGEYITVIGDDDALLRHALYESDRLIRIFKTPLLRWAWAYYKWPDYAHEADANRLSFRVEGPCHRVQSRRLIHELIKEPHRYHELPMIYNSLVHRDLIVELRRRTGRVFNAISPDVYSGFAFADLVGHFPSVMRPMGICGTSGHSTGQATVTGSGPTNQIAAEFFQSSANSGLVWNDSVPLIRKSLSAVVAESQAQYMANLCGAVTWSKAERKSLASAMLRDLLEHPNLSSQDHAAALEQITSWCRDDATLSAWCQQQVAAATNQAAAAEKSQHKWCKGFAGSCFDIDASAFGVTDVDAAAALFENLLGCIARPIAIPRRRPLTIRTVVQTVLPPAIYQAISGSAAARRRKAS